RYGNTSAASIPIALDECVREGRVKTGDMVLMTAFGAGLVWGSVLLRWEGRQFGILDFRFWIGCAAGLFKSKIQNPKSEIMTLALLFPGQGSQSVGMGRSLCELSPAARLVFDEADDVLDFSLTGLCFEGPEEELKLTAN